jgi:SAM-dependent methyltransferase
MRSLCRTASGLVLDVGCGDPTIGASLLPKDAKYVGLDPFCTRTQPFRLIGVGEYLPFKDSSVDGVLFNTSLDHILDWRRALNEAYRVLKPGGTIYLCTLVWTDRADLMSDSVHFHHFREYEILAALEHLQLSIDEVVRYDYKGDTHRHGLYLQARKHA